jgi:molecular chaperone HscB
MLAADDIEDTINEVSSEIERQEWKKAKSAAIKLRYLEGIERAAQKWLDNDT